MKIFSLILAFLLVLSGIGWIAFQLSPGKQFKVHMNRAQMHNELGNSTLAREEYRKAYSFKGGYNSWSSLEILLFENKECLKSQNYPLLMQNIENFWKMNHPSLKQHDSLVVWREYGNAALLSKNWSQLDLAIDKIAQIDSNNFDALWMKLQSVVYRKSEKQLVIYANNLKKQHPDSARYIENFIKSLYKQNNYKKAQLLLEVLLNESNSWQLPMSSVEILLNCYRNTDSDKKFFALIKNLTDRSIKDSILITKQLRYYKLGKKTPSELDSNFHFLLKNALRRFEGKKSNAIIYALKHLIDKKPASALSIIAKNKKYPLKNMDKSAIFSKVQLLSNLSLGLKNEANELTMGLNFSEMKSLKSMIKENPDLQTVWAKIALLEEINELKWALMISFHHLGLRPKHEWLSYKVLNYCLKLNCAKYLEHFESIVKVENQKINLLLIEVLAHNQRRDYAQLLLDQISSEHHNKAYFALAHKLVDKAGGYE